ncbi:unnamed protein product [Toxocara canis]|uniref:Secreted protein n=1 Tax=Toxocara canis TaxID=6265 RepID=A0A183VAV1_TOXCA|nr:unnamed protein product [Toxocara canis]
MNENNLVNCVVMSVVLARRAFLRTGGRCVRRLLYLDGGRTVNVPQRKDQCELIWLCWDTNVYGRASKLRLESLRTRQRTAGHSSQARWTRAQGTLADGQARQPISYGTDDNEAQ